MHGHFDVCIALGSKSVFGAMGVNSFLVVLFRERVDVGLDK